MRSRILKRWSGSTAKFLVGALSILALGWSVPSFAATNQAVDPGGGGATLNASGLLTVNSVPLALVKQARDLSGAVLPNGSNVMSGQTIYFALHVDNMTGVTASDIRISDLLNESEFTYVPNTLETTVVPTGSNSAAILFGRRSEAIRRATLRGSSMTRRPVPTRRTTMTATTASSILP